MEDNPIDSIMRQTNYTREEAMVSLEKNKSVEGCIKEYLGVPKKKEESISVNQGIFKSLREFIDKSSS
jgi:hypothetical protein